MYKQVLVRKEVFVFLALVIASYTVSLFLFLFLEPAPFTNMLGFLSLFCYTATIIPSLIKAVFTSTKQNNTLRCLSKIRRQMGVVAFSFGMNHGFFLILEKNLSLADPQTYIKSFSGILILLIFTVLAITSNDWSVKTLKSNWKKLHQLTYLAIFLLPWHILAKMGGRWSRLTPFGILITTVIVLLFIRRKWIELIKLNVSQKPDFSRQSSKELLSGISSD